MLMTEGVIWKQLLLFSFPLLIGTLFQQLSNTVDSIAAGNFIDSAGMFRIHAYKRQLSGRIKFGREMDAFRERMTKKERKFR